MEGNYAVIAVFWYVSTILLCPEIACQSDGEPFFKNCPTDFKVEAYGGENNANVSWTIPKAYSNSTELQELDPALAKPSMGPGSLFEVQDDPYDVEYVIIDGDGKQAKCIFAFEVVLSEPPTILNCPPDVRPSVVTKYNPGTLPFKIPPRPFFVDNSGDIEDGVESTLPTGAVEGQFYDFPVGVTRIRYVVSDKVGNNKTCEYTVENKIAPPEKLWNISVGIYNSSCITLIWSLTNEATQYKINYWRAIDGRADELTESVPGSDGNLFKQHLICSLSSGTQYTFEIESMTAKYEITHRTEPSVPQDLTTITKPTSVKISWINTDSSSLEQYHIFYHQENRPDAIVDLGYITKDITSYTFDSLAPSTMFTFYVKAVMGTAETRTSSVASIKESTDPIPRDTFVTVTNFTESTIRITWLSIETTDTVLLFINKEKSDSEFQEFYPVFTTSPDYQSSFEFSNLESLTSYTIILVINGENAVYKTITQKTRPGRVEISSDTTTTSSISLTWQGSRDGEYRIRLSPYHSPAELPIKRKRGQDEVTISNLDANTDYYVEIEYVRDGVTSVPVRRILKTVNEEDESPCDEPSLFLVWMTAAIAGMVLFILLVVICGLLCLIPCEEEIPPLPPVASYPESRIGTLYNQTDTASIDIQMAAIRKAENIEAEEDPYSRMISRYGTGTATYKNVFGRTRKLRRTKSKYQKQSTHGSSVAEPTGISAAQKNSDNDSEASYEDVFQPEEQTRYPVSTSQAISRSFDALNNGPKNDQNRNTGLEGNRNSNSMGLYGNDVYHNNIAMSNTTM